jgi:hypothetical protein
MSIIGSELLLGAAGAGGGYEIERSVQLSRLGVPQSHSRISRQQEDVDLERGG